MNVYRREVIEYRVYGYGDATVSSVMAAARVLDEKTGKEAAYVVAHPREVVCLMDDMWDRSRESIICCRGGGKLFCGKMEVKDDTSLGFHEWYVSTTESVTERSYTVRLQSAGTPVADGPDDCNSPGIYIAPEVCADTCWPGTYPDREDGPDCDGPGDPPAPKDCDDDNGGAS